ncbi:MerR family transcriptional regulator, partial [Vibrio parahaemolyticus]|nr:MerR family transcriptional regulator [Vibrio parahaemolyticus]
MACEEKLYAIREVSEITGVKPVTLRAWQRRYNLVQPQRTAKGHRLYTDHD